MSLSRRDLIGSVALAAVGQEASPGARIRVGITTNTRGGWESDVWLSFREAKEVGYRHVESFIHYFYKEYIDDPPALKARIEDMGLKFVTISNGGPLEMQFEDPSKRSKLIEDHMRLIRLIKALGCTHLKINLGGRRPQGTTSADLKEIAVTLNELGKRISDQGLKLCPHAHMWSQFENRREIDYVMAHTDPKHVWFVLDTGHITMAGIDPVELVRTLGHRIVEFHMKDVDPKHRGGAKTRLDRPDVMKDPPFFSLGKGGVDFPAIKAELDRIGWNGWMTVELDSSPDRPPKEAARASRLYLTSKLGLAT